MEIGTILFFSALMGLPLIKNYLVEKRKGEDIIARLPFYDTITYAKPSDTLPPSNTPQGMESKLKYFNQNDKIKGLILEINSGGGSAGASNDIYNMLKEFKKPKVALIKSICASGAYMAACACDEIICPEDSLVGSIGVIMKKPNIEGLMQKLGIKMDILKAGESKDAVSYFKPIPEKERKKLEKLLSRSHERFIDLVLENRKEMPRDVLEEFATGEITDGYEANQLGLVDKIGDLSDAIETCERLGNFKHSYVDNIKDKQSFFAKVLSKTSYDFGKGFADRFIEISSDKGTLYKER